MTRKWWAPTGEPPAWYNQAMPERESSAVSFSDKAFWLELDANSFKWIDALEALDKRDDPSLLLALLPNEVALHFEDLFKRKRLVSRKGGTAATLSYDRSPAEALLEQAATQVKDLINQRVSVAKAVSRVALQRGIPEETLASFVQGKRGASRRLESRRLR